MVNKQLVDLFFNCDDLPNRLLVVGPEGCGKTTAIRSAAEHFGVAIREYSLADLCHSDENSLLETLERMTEAATSDPPVVPLVEHIQGLTMPIIDTKSHYRTSRNAVRVLAWIRECPRWVLEAQTGMTSLLCIIRQQADYELRLGSPKEDDFLAMLDPEYPVDKRKQLALAAVNAGISLRDMHFAIKMVEPLDKLRQPDTLLEIVNGRVFR